MRKILLGLMLFLSVICNGQIDKTENAVSATNDPNFLIGKWKECEYKGNDAATTYSTKIESGQIFIFEKDGSVVIEKDNIKEKGKYEIKDRKKLRILSSKGNSYYRVSIKNNEKIGLTPVTPDYKIICDEGCMHIYEKIN